MLSFHAYTSTLCVLYAFWQPYAQVLSAATLFTSLAPYVCSQLTHLSLQRKVHNEEMEAIQHQLYNWEQLFTQPSTTLTHLSLTACVTDSIVETVMERAPSLTHLGLSDFYREFGECLGQCIAWTVREQHACRRHREFCECSYMPHVHPCMVA